jgi:hypothetical protein
MKPLITIFIIVIAAALLRLAYPYVKVFLLLKTGRINIKLRPPGQEDI